MCMARLMVVNHNGKKIKQNNMQEEGLLMRLTRTQKPKIACRLLSFSSLVDKI
jgi:hypothetical protein